MKLRLEDELKLYVFNREVSSMSELEVKEKLVEIYAQMIVTQNYYNEAIKKAWLG